MTRGGAHVLTARTARRLVLMNRSTSDNIDPSPGPVTYRVFGALWGLLGVWNLSDGHVWIGIGDILFGLAYAFSYQIRRLRKRTPPAVIDETSDAPTLSDDPWPPDTSR